MELLRKHASPPSRASKARGGAPTSNDEDLALGNAAQLEQLGSGAESAEEEEPQGPFSSTLNALLGAAFGTTLDGLDARFGETSQNAAIGAEASTRGAAMSFGEAAEDLHDPEAMEVVAHETAHALADGGSGATALDQPGDRGEQGADQAGARFGAWAARRFEGPAPSLKPAVGGQAEVHRKASSPAAAVAGSMAPASVR